MREEERYADTMIPRTPPSSSSRASPQAIRRLVAHRPSRYPRPDARPCPTIPTIPTIPGMVWDGGIVGIVGIVGWR